MLFYLAPMEGITGYIVRNAYAHYFPYIDKYFTPFIPAAKKMSKKIKQDLAAENNGTDPAGAAADWKPRR